jgi:hypothetical protein
MTQKQNSDVNMAKDQVVVDCFGALLAAIYAFADDRRMHAAEALLDRDDAGAQGFLQAIVSITETAGEVETSSQKWKDRWLAPASAPVTVPDLTPHPKRPGSKLRVHLDGKAIQSSHAAETFARTIEDIGIERVARLGKGLSGIPLIGTAKAADYQQQFMIGGFYICTHSNTPTKKRLLEEISAELRVPLHAEIISDTQALGSASLLGLLELEPKPKA